MLALEPTVRPYGLSDYGRNTDHVGLWDSSQKGPMNQFIFGAYTFSNPYSANMFAYLYRRYDSNVALSTVNLFEKDLKKSAAHKFWDLVSINWGDVIARNWTKAVDWESTVRDMAVAAAGWAVTQIRLSGVLSDQNPNSAREDPDPYVAYALAYWGRNPTKGPAYHVLSYNIH